MVLEGLVVGLVPVNSQLFPWQLQCLKKEIAKATEESRRGFWTPKLAAAGTIGAAGLAVARQPVLPREPPSPTPDPWPSAGDLDPSLSLPLAA